MKNISAKSKRLISLVVCFLMILNMAPLSFAETNTLSAKMTWTEDISEQNWKSVDEAIFNISDFEPGSQAVRYLKLENEGALAFSYALGFNAASESGNLAEVIEVYSLSDVTENVSVSEMEYKGTLKELVNGNKFEEGSILPENEYSDTAFTKETIVAVALTVPENLSKEYMGKETGEFSISLDVSSYNPQDKFSVKLENTADYVYRVGNANAVKLGSLFSVPDGADVGNVTAEIISLDENANVKGTFTANNSDWAESQIQFEGTGIVKVTIDDDKYSNEASVVLEVVNATNVTSYSELKNKTCVLLNDIKMSSGSSYYLSNATLYGNGFTFDVTDGAYESGGNLSSNYLVCLSGSTLDNVKIVGAVYTQYGGKVSDAYNRPVVLSAGNNVITNSYISNCASPVRVSGGTIEISNTTLKGGNFANLDIRNGKVTLDNVTTINQVNGNDTAKDGTVVVGLGVVVYFEQVVNTTTVEVKGNLTQYNCMSEEQASKYIKDTTAKQLVSTMFNDSYSAVQYNDGSTKWINAGILSMTADVGNDNISDVSGYVHATPSIAGATGYLHTKLPDATSISEAVPEYITSGQMAIAPTFSFEYPVDASNKNYIAKTDSSNKYCYYDNGTVLIAFDAGDSVTFDTSILTASKLGQTLPYTVALDGEDCTGRIVTFNQSGTHTLAYTYTDTNNYTVDSNGDIVKYAKEYTKNVYLSVSAIQESAKNATFTFGSAGTASKNVTIGNATYVMPDVSATSSTVGSLTVDGNTVYYPLVEAYTSDGKTAHSSANSWYMCFPVFKNVVTITDYQDAGTGAAVTYNGSTTAMPSGLSFDGYSPYFSSSTAPSGAVSFTTGGADVAFKYQASASAAATPTTLSNVLIYASPSLSNNARNEMYLVCRYKYQDNAGATYYYFVGYHMPETTVSGGGCVTPDTLVTMADGSSKRIDEVSYFDKVMVWDFYKGEYAFVNPAIVFDHNYGNNTVIKLKFDDGTELKVVNLHQLFDADENKFVNVTKDTVASLAGHKFVKADGDSYKYVTLSDYEISDEYVEAYGIISSTHYNIILEGMLTTDFEVQDFGLFNYFEVGENLTFDNEKMQNDIDIYGMYSYEDFEGYLTPEQFDAFNVKYMKVAVGKGQYTYEGILGLVEKWLRGNVDVVMPVGYSEEIDEEPINVVSVISVNEEADASAKTQTITSALNKVSAATYGVTVLADGAVEKDGSYICQSNYCTFTVTANETASTGYVTISVDGDTFTTKQIGKGESIVITVKNTENAKDKAVSFVSNWGVSSAYGVPQENLLSNGGAIDFGTFEIKSVDGVSVTLSNTTKYDVYGDIYVAVYDDESRLYDVFIDENALTKGKDEHTFSPEFTLPDGYTVKAFVWYTDEVKPVVNSYPAK